jgi:membrane-associated phospholipid phosphatase
MRYLKENRRLLCVLLTLPVFFLYLDGFFISQVRAHEGGDGLIHLFLEAVDPIMDVASHGSTLIAAALVLYLAGRRLSGRYREAGRYLIIGFLTAGVAAQGLKHLIGKARPRLTEGFVVIGPSFRSGYDSFPSGHTTVAFCFAYILSEYFPRYRVLFYLFAAATAFERVEDASHFPSDVIAGALLGLLVARLLLAYLKDRGQPAPQRQAPPLPGP